MTTNNTIPKSITRIQEEYMGFPMKFVAVVVGTCLVSLFLIMGILLSEGRIVFIIVQFFVIVFFFKFMRSPSILDRSWLMYQFFIKSMRGQDVMAKFTLPAGFLERIIPLKAFHADGLIEFIDNQYGLLMQIEPSRISDDEIDGHIQKVRGLIDSLHSEVSLKLFVCSIPQGAGFKSLEKNVINIINTQDRTVEQKNHLLSIYHQAHDNKNTVIAWKFYMFLATGKYKSHEEAQIATKQYFPGFLLKLQKCGVLVNQLKDKHTLAAAYRQCITQQGY